MYQSLFFQMLCSWHTNGLFHQRNYLESSCKGMVTKNLSLFNFNINKYKPVGNSCYFCTDGINVKICDFELILIFGGFFSEKWWLDQASRRDVHLHVHVICHLTLITKKCIFKNVSLIIQLLQVLRSFTCE